MICFVRHKEIARNRRVRQVLKVTSKQEVNYLFRSVSQLCFKFLSNKDWRLRYAKSNLMLISLIQVFQEQTIFRVGELLVVSLADVGYHDGTWSL